MTSGSIGLYGCRIQHVSALPNDLEMSTCATNYDASAGLASIGLGGVVSAEYSDVVLFDTFVSDAR